MKLSRRSLARLMVLAGIAPLAAVWCFLGGCCAMDPRGHSDRLHTSYAPQDPGELEPVGGPDLVSRLRQPPIRVQPGENEESREDASTSVVDLASRPVPRIPAGTVIGTRAPQGWSHFIMIAIPTLTPQDLKDAGRTAAHYAQMFKFTLLANTAKGKSGYELKSVARGFAMTVRGKDVIVESGRTFGGSVGMFGNRILAENEKHIESDLQRVARTATMQILDAKAVMRQGTEHEHMILRHAILVDPASDKVHTFIWLMEKQPTGYQLAEKELQWIPDGFREARYLSVKRDKFVLGLPTAEAFALQRTPQGKAVPWTAALNRLAGLKTFTPDQVADLEKNLLELGRGQAKASPKE